MIPQKSLILGPIWGISREFSRNQLQKMILENSWEILEKVSHHTWRIWGNSSLLLLGYRLKPENLRSWLIPIRHLSDVPVSSNWHESLYKSCGMIYMVLNYTSVSIFSQFLYLANPTFNMTHQLSTYSFYWSTFFKVTHQKTVEQEDKIKAILRCTQCLLKNSFTTSYQIN